MVEQNIMKAKEIFSKFWSIIVKTFKEWNASDPFRESAIMSYYAILSLPGLLIIIIWLVGKLFGQQAVEGELQAQISSALGPRQATYIQELVNNAYLDANAMWYMQVIGICTLVFGATTLFFQLQKTLNNIWNVQANIKSGIKKLVLNRASSLGLIIVIAFLMLISLVLSSLLNVFHRTIENILGGDWKSLMTVVNMVISFGVITVLFAMMFKFLPDIRFPWSAVWIGAIFTTLLFNLGKTALSYYFGVSDPGSSFGAAGTIIIIMVWINYTTLILLFGAKFTQVYARKTDCPILPAKHAAWSEDYIAAHRSNIFEKLVNNGNEELAELDQRIAKGRYRTPGESDDFYEIQDHAKS